MTIGPDKLQAISAAANRSVEADIPDEVASQEIATAEREAGLTLKQQATLFQVRFIKRLEDECSRLREESEKLQLAKNQLQTELHDLKVKHTRLDASVIAYEKLDWPISIGFLIGTCLMGGFQLTNDPVWQKVLFFMGTAINVLLTVLTFYRAGKKSSD